MAGAASDDPVMIGKSVYLESVPDFAEIYRPRVSPSVAAQIWTVSQQLRCRLSYLI